MNAYFKSTFLIYFLITVEAFLHFLVLITDHQFSKSLENPKGFLNCLFFDLSGLDVRGKLRKRVVY